MGVEVPSVYLSWRVMDSVKLLLHGAFLLWYNLCIIWKGTCQTHGWTSRHRVIALCCCDEKLAEIPLILD